MLAAVQRAVSSLAGAGREVAALCPAHRAQLLDTVHTLTASGQVAAVDIYILRRYYVVDSRYIDIIRQVLTERAGDFSERPLDPGLRVSMVTIYRISTISNPYLHTHYLQLTLSR